MVLGLSFLGSVVIQVLSVLRLIRFLTTTKKTQILLSLVALLLSVIYLHQVIAMLAAYWGYPALKMTLASYEWSEGWINESYFCLFDHTNE